ncbi:MAG: VOC family protein [Cyclobacteriaceae bacterium]
MRNEHLIILLLCGILAACDNPNEQTSGSATTGTISEKDTVPRVTGIGGIFFIADDPQKIMGWYGDNLGLAIDDFGSPFEFRNAHRPDEINYLRWHPQPDSSDYFNPSSKPFMINYRVNNIEGLVAKLEEKGITMLDEISTFEYGKFVHLMDPEGNKIELWEPVDSFLTQLGGATTK